MFDINSMPVSGGVILAGALWAGLSIFALGPVVAERELERDGWLKSCEMGLKAAIRSQRQSQTKSMVPEFDCSSTFGAIYGAQGQALCRQYGNFNLPVPGLDQLREQERRLKKAEKQRVERAASKAGSRCECAAAHYMAEERLSLAIYAGSGRLIIPSEIKNRDAELGRALATPACTKMMEG